MTSASDGTTRDGRHSDPPVKPTNECSKHHKRADSSQTKVRFARGEISGQMSDWRCSGWRNLW